MYLFEFTKVVIDFRFFWSCLLWRDIPTGRDLGSRYFPTSGGREVSPVRPREAPPFNVGKQARLRVNLEPLGLTQGLELVERQAPAFRPGSREVHFMRVS